MLRLDLRMRCMIQCNTCLQGRDAEEASATEIEVRLFGAEPFAQCPDCLQEVPKELQTETYRILWRVRWAKRREEERGAS